MRYKSNAVFGYWRFRMSHYFFQSNKLKKIVWHIKPHVPKYSITFIPHQPSKLSMDFESVCCGTCMCMLVLIWSRLQVHDSDNLRTCIVHALWLRLIYMLLSIINQPFDRLRCWAYQFIFLGCCIMHYCIIIIHPKTTIQYR